MNFSNLMFVALVIMGINMSLGYTAIAQTRLGLHVTQEELNIWKQRAASGPYKSAGDASTNSPGDWDRIVANRNAFASNPSNGRWTSGPTALTNGCVARSGQNVPLDWFASSDWARRLRDAAFYNRVMGVATDHAAIKRELLWLVSQSWAQFGAPNGIWCFGVIWDGDPSFSMATWLTRLLFAYDYVGRAAFTSSELSTLDRWFFDAADFWERDTNEAIRTKFVNREGGDYTPTIQCWFENIKLYYGGPAACSINRHYNNRYGSMVRFFGLTGLYLTSHGRSYTDGRYGSLAYMVSNAKLYVQEYVRFGIFPHGIHADFERRGDGNFANNGPEIGWNYAGGAIGEVYAIADAFARNGDTSLYDFKTSTGLGDSAGIINDGGSRAGQNKDLLFGLQAYMKYHTDVYARYCDATAANIDCSANSPSSQNNRIDGRHPRSGTSSWDGNLDIYAAFSNLYFQDTFVKQAYTRTHAGAVPYPSNGGNTFQQGWQGENAVWPGVLFMFGQMEGKVWPYMSNEPEPPPSPPTNLRVISQGE